MRVTKTQLFQQTKYDVCELLEGTREERFILSDVCSVKELKDDLKYCADKYYALKKQEGRGYKMYHGQIQIVSDAKVDAIIQAVHSVANKCGYEVYSPNGAWFVRSK